jgi:hypothetical protein
MAAAKEADIKLSLVNGSAGPSIDKVPQGSEKPRERAEARRCSRSRKPFTEILNIYTEYVLTNRDVSPG